MYEELKKAAEACKDLLPLRYMESHGSLYIRNDCGIVFDVHQNRSFPDFMAHNKAYADLALAANPSAVLALIAENERLALELKDFKWGASVEAQAGDEARAEASQLKVENEALRKAAGQVLSWIEAKHRPPVPDLFEHGRMALVRLHALAELHEAMSTDAIN